MRHIMHFKIRNYVFFLINDYFNGSLILRISFHLLKLYFVQLILVFSRVDATTHGSHFFDVMIG